MSAKSLYVATLDRLEPDIADMDSENSLTSIAISLKRVADVLEGDQTKGDFLTQLFGVLGDASHNHAQRMK